MTAAGEADASQAAARIPPEIAERAFQRASGASLIRGNAVRILRDAAEHFPAWLDAVRSARESVLFECYIVDEGGIGADLAAAMAARARDGVRVRFLYDWLGSLRIGALPRRLQEAGVHVRCFNRPRLDSPFGWLSRDHRKMIAIDGETAFVTGLCVSDRWLGDPSRNIDPWRDTGVEVRGPAVAALTEAFADAWGEAGPTPMPASELRSPDDIAPAGDYAVRIVAGRPSATGLLRLDQLVASFATSRLWLTDAYFVAWPPYVQSLCAAARDGVDVRLLVPGASDVPIVSALSRAGYRPLLEAGVRVFEWNGSMLHAKSAVADSRWARVGSTNLNVASWMSNFELDVAVEDPRFAAEMAAMYEDDLRGATEIVLTRRNRVQSSAPRPRLQRPRRAASGSAGRAAAGAIGLGSTVGAALTNRRLLGPAETGVLVKAALALLVLSLVLVLWPRVIAVPLAIVGTWVAIAMLLRARSLRRGGTAAAPRRSRAKTPLTERL